MRHPLIFSQQKHVLYCNIKLETPLAPSDTIEDVRTKKKRLNAVNNITSTALNFGKYYKDVMILVDVEDVGVGVGEGWVA